MQDAPSTARLATLRLAGLTWFLLFAMLASLGRALTTTGAGDDQILWHWTDASKLSYSATELLDYLEQNFPGEDFAPLRKAIEKDKDITVTELLGGSPNPSVHDKTTIAIQTGKYPLWVCALGLWHEWWHIQHIAPESGPNAQDPETLADNPCGQCNHLTGLLDQLEHIASLSCEGVVPSQESCTLWKKALKGAGKVYYDCLYEGPNCSSYGGLPFDQILTPDMRPCNCN